MGKRKWVNPSGTSTYYVWRNMVRRCTNPKDSSFKHYGGRGITVDSSWATNYDSFVRDMGLRPEKLTLERKDNDKGYSKTNCAWVSYSDNLNNQRRNRRITYHGKTQTVTQWALELGINRDTLSKRLTRMPIERALTLSRKPSLHGTRQSYENGCRCPSCKEANTRRCRKYRERKTEMEQLNAL